MEIETTIISIDRIKPSSPTPKALQNHRLSFIDQIAPALYSNLVYFYESNTKIPNSQKSNHLKKSLSRILTRFYPLAGHLVGDLYVDCDDGGAAFYEAEANCDLSEVITKPNPTEMDKFLPSYKFKETHDFCMAVQATYFRCGGAAVGILISHKIADALSFISFANAWSDVASNGDSGGAPPPKFDAATYFPPRDFPILMPSTEMIKEEIAIRTFTFSAEKIDVLRQRYSVGGGLQRWPPTRVEALSAFIWDRFISATGMRSDPNKIHAVSHTVNLRTKIDPSLPEYLFGNLTWVRNVILEVGDRGVELMQRLREAVKAIDDAYLAEVKEGEKHLNFLREIMAQAHKGELLSFGFSSLCRFPSYEADFGWGKPVWIGFAGFPYKNSVIFMDTRNRDGIEAIIHLKKEDMEKFEADLELQEFLSYQKSFLISKI